MNKMEISLDIEDAATLKFGQLVREKKQKGEKIISLGLGEPNFDTPSPIIESTYEALRAGWTRYSDPLGLEELRHLIKNKLKTENKIETSNENIIVTPGAKNALFLALMALLKPSDEVITISPCYVSYVPQIKLAEPTAIIKNVDLTKNDFSINWTQLEKKISEKTKAILLNFPNNPTGKMISKKELQRLINLVGDKNCYVISDEIYEKLNFSGFPHYSIGSFHNIKDRVITINGFSKSFAMTGWRIGYLVANLDTIKIVSKLQQHINTNTCTFVQKGACTAFLMDSNFLDSYNNKLKENASFMLEVFGSNEKLHLTLPQGGLFAFLNISKTGLTSEEFCSELLIKKGVVVIPGIAFGINWDDYIRITLGVNKNEFQEGIRLIDEFTKEIGGV